MLVRYEDLEILINNTCNMVDRQEFQMRITRKGKVYQFILEGYRTDPDEPVTWRLHLQDQKKIVGSMRNVDLYRDVIELMEKAV